MNHKMGGVFVLVFGLGAMASHPSFAQDSPSLDNSADAMAQAFHASRLRDEMKDNVVLQIQDSLARTGLRPLKISFNNKKNPFFKSNGDPEPKQKVELAEEIVLAVGQALENSDSPAAKSVRNIRFEVLILDVTRNLPVIGIFLAKGEGEHSALDQNGEPMVHDLSGRPYIQKDAEIRVYFSGASVDSKLVATTMSAILAREYAFLKPRVSMEPDMTLLKP